MTISKPSNFLFTTILLLVLCNSLFSQKLEPKERLPEPDHTITSKITGHDYQLYMSFPRGYSTKDTISYPILYVLDGWRDFEFFNTEQRRLSGKIEDVIIIGISSGLDGLSFGLSRTLDYTTTVDTIFTRDGEKKFNLPKGTAKSGGASQFLEALKTEITPFVDKHYKTNSERGISGHSFAGLFTAYVFLNSDGFFTKFGINSPSLWWDEKKLLDQAILQFTENKTWNIPPTKVYISVGGKEGIDMVPQMIEFSLNLEEASYNNIDLKWHVFDDESHGSVIRPSLTQTLIELYGKD
ncbi:alpha/beta hydrolase [Xanthomarina sp. GH4-25]|uniref:alpha/beta hydrolase n=1 Tax=Xanthomarina sp. GH4-25 TaxID=3349335 RepID=UPI003877C140